VQVTDIPDWCFVEVFGSTLPPHQSGNSVEGTSGKAVSTLQGAGFPLSPEIEKGMHEASPIWRVGSGGKGSLGIPVMMFLGAKDRRVPHIDGLAYANALRSFSQLLSRLSKRS
jgi:hypothetical protein